MACWCDKYSAMVRNAICREMDKLTALERSNLVSSNAANVSEKFLLSKKEKFGNAAEIG